MIDKKTQLLLDKGEALPVMEAFYTIQGEGYHKGTASYFFRTGGCDVGCHWCDVKESWDHGNHNILKVSKIIQNIDKISNIKSVIVQGRHDVICPPFTALRLANYWDKAKIEIVDDAGHSGFETNVSKKLINALQMIK